MLETNSRTEWSFSSITHSVKKTNNKTSSHFQASSIRKKFLPIHLAYDHSHLRVAVPLKVTHVYACTRYIYQSTGFHGHTFDTVAYLSSTFFAYNTVKLSYGLTTKNHEFTPVTGSSPAFELLSVRYNVLPRQIVACIYTHTEIGKSLTLAAAGVQSCFPCPPQCK